MSVSFVNMKCDCGGKLQYDSKRKVWVCLYCGSEVERTTHSDVGINNSVRQTILDAAYHRMESALKNLEECEKTDPKNIGTLIANLCVCILLAAVSAKQEDIRASLSKLKRYCQRLQADFPQMTDEETLLYDFCGGDTSDAYANLALVYDSIGETQRRDYVLKLTDAREVYSPDVNKGLLSFAIKNGMLEMADQIAGNTANIDKRAALTELLFHYPDAGRKVQNVTALLEGGAFEANDAPTLLRYVRESADKARTKSAVLREAMRKGIKVPSSIVLESVLSGDAGAEDAGVVFQTICGAKLDDREVGDVVAYCLSSRCKNADIAVLGLSALKNSGQFVQMDQRALTGFLEQAGAADPKTETLKTALSFNIDGRTLDSVFGYYLCENKDPFQTRKAILGELAARMQSAPVSAVESYVLRNASDGEGKPEIVDIVFRMTANPGFYSNLLSGYLLADIDTPPTREKIVGKLAGMGLKADPRAFAQYLSAGRDSAECKARHIRLLLANGYQMRSDAWSAYLASLLGSAQYSPELSKLLLTENAVIMMPALANYALYCRELAEKPGTFSRLVAAHVPGLGSHVCTVRHLGNEVACNLLQAYVLMNEDPFDTADGIVNILLQNRLKLNDDIRVNGSPQKFKKYVVANKDRISISTNKLCEQNRVFHALF